MLQDLVLAALNDAKAVAEQTQQERLGPLTAGMSLPGF
jgi:DNA-binding protein YbaB